MFGVVVALVMDQDEAALILAGVALGAMVVETPALEPVGNLLRACAPITLPLLVIAAVGAIHRDWWVALGAGVLFAVVAWTWLVRPDLPVKDGHQRDALGETLRQLVRAILWLAVAVAIARILVATGIADTQDASQSIGDVATTLFVAGVVIWAAALVIRLFSFGINPARLTVSFALVAAFYLLMVSIGVLDGPKRVLGLSPAMLLAVAGGALVVEILWVVAKAVAKALASADEDLGEMILASVERRLATGGRLERAWMKAGRALDGGTTGATRVGLLAALLSSAVLATATAVALIDTADQSTGTPLPDSARIEPGPEPQEIVRGLAGEQRDLKLARAYMPVLAFHKDQRWAPTTVERYLDHPDNAVDGSNDPVFNAVLTTLDATARPLEAPICEPKALVTPCEPRTVSNLPSTCPELAKVPCYRLDIACPDATKRCAKAHPRPSRRPRYRDGAVYVRVLARDRAGNASSADVFSDVGPYRTGEKDVLWTLVQYWYFYRYNEWKQRVLPGDLVQRHESDWEAVTIGLARDKPLFVAYSAHCGGSWRRWSPDQVPAARTGRPWTHPVVAVAEGSQANYPRAEQSRPPNWDVCSGVPGLKAGLISYAANVRDRTGYDWQWVPRRVIRVTSKEPLMRFPGHWGGHDETRLVNRADLEPLQRGAGPLTPSLQPLWQDPVGTIFCSPHWSAPRTLHKRTAETCRARTPMEHG